MKRYEKDGTIKPLSDIVVSKGGMSYYNPTETMVEEAGWTEYKEEESKEQEIDYERAVVALIREKYSVDEELALLRQRDEKEDEFKDYYDYCEECKTKIKEALGIETEATN